MSWRSYRAVGAISGIDPTARHVLMQIAWHVNHRTESAVISSATLAYYTGLGERTVRYAVDRLEAAELLTVHRRPGQAARYEIYPGICDRGTPAAAADGTPADGAATPAADDKTPAAAADIPRGTYGVPDDETRTPAVAAEHLAIMRTRIRPPKKGRT